MYRVVGKLNRSISVLAQDARVKQSVRVAVNGFYVPAGTTRRFAQRHRVAAGHGSKQFPALRGEHLPEQIG